MAKEKTAWQKHLMAVYKAGKTKNKAYTFTDAMKEAKKSYKK